MSAFFFGTSERPLFGFYHQPTRRPVQQDGVVLCNAMGDEYLRTHRTLKQLATRLADKGFHVLRFDYSGTGDSAGEGDDASLDRWREEVSLAADELKAMTAVRRVSLVGVRVGAALAAHTGTQRRDVEDVVLWDPVIDGADYLAELSREADVAGGGRSGPNGRARPSARMGVNGFPLPVSLQEELAEVDLTGISGLRARRALLVVSEKREEHETLSHRLSELGPEVRHEHRPGSEGWENPGRMGSVVLVPAIVGTIVDFFEHR